MDFPKPDFYLHAGWFDLPRVEEIIIGGVPEALQGKKALFVSDVHLRPNVPDAKLNALVSILQAQRADLLLLGGDYAETAHECARFFEAQQVISAPMGAFAIMGNNDSECFPDPETLRSLMAKNNVHLLINESVSMNEIEIGGCGDHMHGKAETKSLFGKNAYRILLSHFPAKPDCHAELMFSGHTHGGQFNFLGLTPYCIGFEHKYALEAVSGLHCIEKRKLIVSKGIGVSKLPLRIGVSPQVILVKFTG